MESSDNANLGRIYTVSDLTSRIKRLLESQFPFLWVTGEISNFRKPASGHYYFVLKDAGSQINAVMFRGQNQMLKFVPEDGMSVTGLGRVSVYEPRGTYQLIFELLEPKGIGALQVAFEQLKSRLTEEGLFDDDQKKPLPFLPQKIGLITSPTGAVVHDILNILNRRFPSMPLLIYPARVQGDGAESEISDGLDYLNSRDDIDVIVVARGGGSLEDLQAFNSESVARAIFRSIIPVVSAIGHETDFTISDFVADLRAPTPSAAAEMLVPVRADLISRCQELLSSLIKIILSYIEYLRNKTTELENRLIDPKKKLQDFRLRTDDLTFRIANAFGHLANKKHEQYQWLIKQLDYNNPISLVHNNKVTLYQINNNMQLFIDKIIKELRSNLKSLDGKISALNPQSVLDRGYSITQTIPEKTVITDTGMVNIGQDLNVLLAKGSLKCRVKGKTRHGKNNI